VKLPVTLTLASRDAYEDEGRREFLLILDASTIPLDQWHKSFVYSNCLRKDFTPAQRKVIDRLAIQYAHIY
jgi:hypothetical protein